MSIKYRSKKEKELIEQVLNGTYKSEQEQRMEKRDANLREQQAIAKTKKSSASGSGGSFSGGDIAPVKEAEDDKKWYQTILKKSNAFDNVLAPIKDGYQFGDITKTGFNTIKATTQTILGTGADVGLGLVKGVAQTGEGIGKLISGGVAQVADWTGNDEYAEKVRKNLATKDAPVSSFLAKQQEKVQGNSIIGNTGDKVSEAIGYIGSIWATGGAGTATMITSGTGNALEETYKKAEQKGENVEDWQVWTKSIGTGLIETATEKLFGVFGTSGLDKGIANAISARITSGAGKVFSRLGVQATGEAVEEFLSYAGSQGLDYMIDVANTATGGNGMEFKEDWNWEEVGEQMAIAYMASGTLGGGANVTGIANIKTQNDLGLNESVNEYARQEDVKGQLEDVNNEIKKLEKKIEKTTDVKEKEQLQEELEWKKKQVVALQNNLEYKPTAEDIQAQIEEKEAEIEQKIEEQEETDDPRLKEIIQDEIDVLQEEQNNIQENAQQITKPITNDNKGRELPKELQETLKDVKTVDEKGSVKNYYHGTRGEFDKFDNSKIGQNYEGDWSILGKGFYFTENYDEAKEFGESSINEGDVNVKGAYLNIKKPFYNDMAQNDSNVLDQLKEKYNLEESDFSDAYNLLRVLRNKDVDTTEVLKEYGYDGIITEDEAVAFDSEQIIDSDKQAKEDVKPEETKAPVQETVEETTQTNDYEQYLQRQEKTLEKAKNISQELYEEQKKSMESEKKTIKGYLYRLTNSAPITGVQEADSFFVKRQTDFDKYNGKRVKDGKVQVMYFKKGDNEAKLSVTEGKGRLWIDELYVKNQKQGYGKEIVEAVKQYANKKGLVIDISKEVGSAKGFWDKVLDRKTQTEESKAPVQDTTQQTVETDVPIKTVVNKNGLQMSVGDKVELFNSSKYTITGIDKIDDDFPFVRLENDKGTKTSIHIDSVVKNFSNPKQTVENATVEEDIITNAKGEKTYYYTVQDKSGNKITRYQFKESKTEQEIKDWYVYENTEVGLPFGDYTAEELEANANRIREESSKSLEEEEPLDFDDLTTVFDEVGVEDVAPTTPSPLESRDIDEVGNRKVKAYQYEHPEIRPYFQAEAENMLYDLDNTIKGEKIAIKDEAGYITDWAGMTRQTTEAIAYLKDKYGYSYAEIRKGLNAIIEDHGAENIAVAKRIEFMLDERLREGYTTSDGIPIPANEDYIKFLEERGITEFNSQAIDSLAVDENVPVKETPIEEVAAVNETTPTETNENIPIKPQKEEVNKVVEPSKETAQNQNTGVTEVKENDFSIFELSKEQKSKIKELKAFNQNLIDNSKKFSHLYDPQDLNKKIKGIKVVESADIRKIVQGDLLIPIQGGLTPIELNKEITRLKSNYKGKEVIVDGKQGKIVGNAFGKIGVEFEDGTQQYVEKNLVQPVQDIDAIIKEQTELYKQYKESKAPSKKTTVTDEKAPVGGKTLTVDNRVVTTKKVAVNQTLEDNKTSFDKESKFYKNITERSEFLDEEIREMFKDDKDIKNYQSITNKDTLNKAMNRIAEGGEYEAANWLGKDIENADAVDVAEGWILLEHYRDKMMNETDKDIKDKQAEIISNIARKMREMGTRGGQLVQAFAIQERLTPNGMLKYAQSELTDLFQVMSKNKGKEWIKQHEKNFTLDANDQTLIIENMTEVESINADEHFVENRLSELESRDTSGMTKEQLKKHKQEIDLYKNHDIEYIKRAKIAEIQAQMQNKIPPVRGQALKAWMRMSMLFNPKTQVRNVGGNALLVPVNIVSDTFSSVADSIIAKTTGVRTKGNFHLKDYSKGFNQGIYESWSDFRRGINTKNVESKYEVSQGKSFNENHTGKFAKQRNAISKGLNVSENVLNFVMNAGDRGFMKASTLNSLNNQIVLNTSLQAKQNGENILISTAENGDGLAEITYADSNGKVISRKIAPSKVSKFIENNNIKNSIPVTKEMLTIAENEGLQRTWNDNNEYTRFVLNFRRGLNKIGVEGYGLGDVLIPFAKTPANITKAIIDYSPAGMVKTIIDGVNLKKSVENGQFTAEAQHQFVTELGKATVGTLLYGLGTALALAGMTSGSGDEDKDVKNFEKNVLGKNPYSIEIFGKSFTYDWAQPLAAPLAITASIVESVQSEEEKELTDYLKQAAKLTGDLILEQSFMQSVNSVINHNEGIVMGLLEAVMELPARAVPTFAKQIADMFDGTQRQTFEYNQGVQSQINTIKNKIPFLSDDLAPSVNTLGEDIQKYGGENNAFNVFFNPATVNSSNISEAGEEIYRVYQETGEKGVMPVTTPYHVKKDGKKINLSSEQRAEIQRMSGTLVESNVSELLEDNQYQSMSDEDKAVLLSNLVGYANQKAQSEILGEELSTTYQSVDRYVNLGGTPAEYYTANTLVNKITNEYEENKELAEDNKERIKELAKEKKTAIIDVMLDLDATDQQKMYLYSREFSSEETLNKIIDKGTSMDTYLQFSKDTVDFEGEKDEEGNTINGSKGNKYEKYLLDSNMSDNDKATLYEYEVLSDFEDEDSHKAYKTIKSAGININYYLDFSSQTIESDKNYKGETIRNSKRDKTISYINTYNLDIPQKAIMIKSQYKAWDTYNSTIIDYVDSLSIDYDEKVKMLENLDFTVNDSGDVYWK